MLSVTDPFDGNKMNDVQIGSGDEASLSIDAQSFGDSICIFILALICIFGVAISSFYSPLYHKYDHRTLTMLDQLNGKYKFEIFPIQPLAILSNIDMSVLLNKGDKYPDIYLNYEYTIKNGQQTVSAKGNTSKLNFVEPKDTSDNITIHDLANIHADSISIELSPTNADQIKNIYITYGSVNPVAVEFHLVSRSIFFISTLMTLVVYGIKVAMQDGQRVYEEIITLTLMFVTLLYINPLFFFALKFNSETIHLIDLILCSFAIGYVLFFIISVTFGYQSVGLVPILIGIIGAAFSFANMYFPDNNLVKYVSLIFYCQLTFVVIIGTTYMTKNTSAKKYYIYACINILTLAGIIAYIITTMISAVAMTSVPFCLIVAVLFSFGVIMTYFHWPFEADINMEYLEPGDKDVENFQADFDDMPMEIKIESTDDDDQPAKDNANIKEDDVKA